MPSILLVASSFAPSRMIGGRRAERIASFLSRAGWQVTVLTLHPSYAPAIDANIQEPAGTEVIRTHAAMPRTWLRKLQVPVQTAKPADRAAQDRGGTAGPARRLRGHVLALARQGFARAVAPIEFPDELQGWRQFALRAVAGRRFDVVMATMPPFSGATLALEIVRRSGGRLVLDYRDPWCEVLDPQGRHGDLRLSPADWQRMQKLEARCLSAADLVIGVTPTICGWLTPRTRAPVVLISNGLDGPPSEPLPVVQPPRLVYAGSLAYGRSLAPVLAAMAQLRAESPLELVYAGPHGEEVRHQAAALGMADRVKLLGNIALKDVLALYRGALAGIVAVSAMTDYGYPGKLFEVLGAGCPVLLLAPQACDAAQLVRRHHAGWVHDGPEIDSLVSDLREALAAAAPSASGLDQLAPQVLMGELDQRLRALLA